MSTVLAIPDPHCPFMHKDAPEFLAEVKQVEKPNEIVLLGDEEDQAGLGEYDKDPDGYSAGMEHELALVQLKELFKLFPNVRVCTSNHTGRIFKKAFKHGIPKAYLKDYREFLGAPEGWVWKESFIIDGVKYEHGEGFSGDLGALKCAIGNHRSTAIGHLHSNVGIIYNAAPSDSLIPDGLIFGFGVGCLIDDVSYCFKYNKTQKKRPILGCGIIKNAIPKFIPMLLDKHKRWVGHL